MSPKPIYQTVFVLWGALCFSLVMYGVMLKLMNCAPVENAGEPLAGIFALMAGIAAAMSLVLRKVLLGGFANGRLKVDELKGRNRFMAGNVVVFALSESVGVLGFLNGLMREAETDAWLPFIGGALILMLVHLPLPSRFEGVGTTYQR